MSRNDRDSRRLARKRPERQVFTLGSPIEAVEAPKRAIRAKPSTCDTPEEFLAWRRSVAAQIEAGEYPSQRSRLPLTIKPEMQNRRELLRKSHSLRKHLGHIVTFQPIAPDQPAIVGRLLWLRAPNAKVATTEGKLAIVDISKHDAVEGTGISERSS